MHHYHLLQENLNRHPVGAPKTQTFIEILKILFTPAEAELAVHLDFKFKKADELAGLVGIEVAEAHARLEEMANRGTILAKQVEGEMAYALLPLYPGLFEYPFMKGLEPTVQERLAELWHAYYMEAMAAELAAAQPPWNRILPAEEALPSEYEILPYEVASQMIARSSAVAVANCPCRIAARKCNRPLNVCLSFDGAARFLAERGMARLISHAEAEQVLKAAEEAGLVHTASNNAERLVFLCNCCPCCCHFLRLVVELNYPQAVACSSYVVSLDSQLCTGCGICSHERCPAGALTLVGEQAVLEKEKCLGCGLCVTTCPAGALKLIKREGYQPPPATAAELVKAVVLSKKDIK